MLHVALLSPEIPPNTGNIIRLCANSGALLHLIHPLGFTLDDKRARRAGLDYHELANLRHYPNLSTFLKDNATKRIYACSTKAHRPYADVCYQEDDLFLFGPETQGLPESLIAEYNAIRIPMQPQSRSLNLSNAVAIILFEAWRQLAFRL